MRKSKNTNTILIAISLLLFGSARIGLQAQSISSTLFGQNAWYTTNSETGIGHLDHYWDDIDSSGVKQVRIGGIAANFRPLYSFDRTTLAITNVTKLKRLIDSIRNNGMQPIIQVSYNPVCINDLTVTTNNPLAGLTLDQQATIAANLVDSINNVEYTSNPIVYWIIGNEPDGDRKKGCDHVDGPSGGYGITNAEEIAIYIKKFSSKMKERDASIKIIGPETSYFRTSIMERLTDTGTPAIDITKRIGTNPYFYIDVYSFHIYNGFTGSQSRDTVVRVLTSPDKFQVNLAYLNKRLDSCNSYHNRGGGTEIKNGS